MRNFAYVNIEESIAQFELYAATELRRAPGTVEQYSRTLHELCRHLQEAGIHTVEVLSSQQLRQWLMAQSESGKAATTLRRELSAVRHWCHWMRQNSLVEADLTAKLSAPKLPKRLPVTYKEGEAAHLYDDELWAADFATTRDRLVLMLLYETGMRRAELAALTEADVDLAALYIKVLGKRNKHRLVPIEPELAHRIAAYLDQKHRLAPNCPALIVSPKGQPLAPSAVNYIVTKRMTALTTANRVSPHVFRHSFASHLLANGGDLMAISHLLGHSNLNATQVYTHLDPAHIGEAYRHAHPRAKSLTQNNKEE
ncbi:MAG: tyrosine-type recombinase/integrase [Bacteroidales bacterium]|nr:tyrosine-type recombinase/integrase [Bacteroidales bacterium]